MEQSDRVNLLECFDNPHPKMKYVITHNVEEFTSLCPKTGHPDFATMEIDYIPKDECIELKSLKLYLQSYRNEGVFYEKLCGTIFKDLLEFLRPIQLRLTANFKTRGGLNTEVIVDSELL